MTRGALLVEHDLASAFLVRRQLACDLANYEVPPAVIEDAVLVASELVSNAVRHTSPSESGTLDVTWDVDPGGVRVSVSDPSAEPLRQRIAKVDETSGRGLAIVDAMSDGWGVQHGAHGKSVWAHVAAPQRD